ncbi:hypothetical protein [Rhizobium sp. YTU87027]|uniref:hypothetical protein n=1 Tax=Rhizobium sp. YTU87027 TaxID=3417741 RepID=UPI003D696694
MSVHAVTEQAESLLSRMVGRMVLNRAGDGDVVARCISGRVIRVGPAARVGLFYSQSPTGRRDHRLRLSQQRVGRCLSEDRSAQPFI